MQSVIVSK